MSGLSDEAKANLSEREIAALEQLHREGERQRQKHEQRDDWQSPDPKAVLDNALSGGAQGVRVEYSEHDECAICDWNMTASEVGPQVALCAEHRDEVWHELSTTMLRAVIPEDQQHARPSNAHRTLQPWLPHHGSLYLFGPTGVGKSHDQAAMLKRAWVEWRKQYNAAPSVAWVNVPDFIEQVLDTFGTSAKVNMKWRDVDILVFEDIGLGDQNPFAVRKIYTALDRRSQRRRRQVTLISSNLNLDELAEHLKDDRIPSRIDGMCAQVSYVGMPDRRSSMGPTLPTAE